MTDQKRKITRSIFMVTFIIVIFKLTATCSVSADWASQIVSLSAAKHEKMLAGLYLKIIRPKAFCGSKKKDFLGSSPIFSTPAVAYVFTVGYYWKIFSFFHLQCINQFSVALGYFLKTISLLVLRPVSFDRTTLKHRLNNYPLLFVQCGDELLVSSLPRNIAKANYLVNQICFNNTVSSSNKLANSSTV